MSQGPVDTFAGMEPIKALPPEVRRRQLAHRSRYRGIKEMDIIMSQFCEAILPTLSDDELGHFDALLRESDHDLYAWISRRTEPPQSAHNNPLLQKLLDFDFKPVSR